MHTTKAVIALFSACLLLLTAGCTDPTRAPTLLSIAPNPISPLSTGQAVHFYGENQDVDVYYILDTGSEQITLGPNTAPGRWTFRCVFGFHFTYHFDGLQDFLGGLGNPQELGVTAYNVGEDLTNDNGGGDDLPSRSVNWVIQYE
jgi:hypothetical protein